MNRPPLFLWIALAALLAGPLGLLGLAHGDHHSGCDDHDSEEPCVVCLAAHSPGVVEAPAVALPEDEPVQPAPPPRTPAVPFGTSVEPPPARGPPLFS